MSLKLIFHRVREPSFRKREADEHGHEAARCNSDSRDSHGCPSSQIPSPETYFAADTQSSERRTCDDDVCCQVDGLVVGKRRVLFVLSKGEPLRRSVPFWMGCYHTARGQLGAPDRVKRNGRFLRSHCSRPWIMASEENLFGMRKRVSSDISPKSSRASDLLQDQSSTSEVHSFNNYF